MLANRKLRGMYTDGEPTGPGFNVVTRECALPLSVKLALGSECQRVRGNDRSLSEQLSDGGRKLGSVHGGDLQ